MDSVASFSSSLRIFEMWKNCGFAAKKTQIFGSYCPISLDPVKIFELCKNWENKQPKQSYLDFEWTL